MIGVNMKHVSKKRAQDLFSWGRKMSRKVKPGEYNKHDSWRYFDQGHAYQLIVYSCEYMNDDLKFLKLIRNKIDKAIRKHNRKK